MYKFAEMRAKKGMTQGQVADKLGVDRSSVAKWETGAAEPSIDKLSQMARLYECSIDALITETEAAK